MSRKYLLLILLLSLGAVAAGLYWQSSADKRVVQLPRVEGCGLHQQACSAELPAGVSVEFEMSPRPLPTTDPIGLRARFSGMDPERVVVLFEGKDMYMGFLQYPLRRVNSSQFEGKGSLSICIRRLMEWVARVQVDVGDVIYEVQFEFETISP